MTKARAQRVHAKRRARERFGLTLNRHDLRAVVRDIQAARAEHVCRQSLRVSIWRVVIGGKAMLAAYDNKRKTVATLMPTDWKVA